MGIIGFVAFVVISVVGIMVIYVHGKKGNFKGAANSVGVVLLGCVILALGAGAFGMAIGTGVLDSLFKLG